MNRIQSIKRFLEDYETLNPSLKQITSWSYKHYQDELRKEYLKRAQHPHPEEVL